MMACGSLHRKVFALAQAHRQRAAAPRADDDIGHVEVQHGDAVGADDLFERGAHGFEQTRFVVRAARLVVNLADEVGEDFGVGLGGKRVPGLDQRGAEHLVVFDDPVVDQGEAARLVEVRVGVFIDGPAVRGPARVADADAARRGLFLEQIGEGLDASGAFAALELAAVDGRDPGGVVAAVFQPPQPVEQDGGGR